MPKRNSLSDRLEEFNLDITRRALLDFVSLDKIATDISKQLGEPIKANTLSRVVRGWIEAGRYDLILSGGGKINLLPLTTNESLEEDLRRKTRLNNASVLNIKGLESAFNEDYRLNPNSKRAQMAYQHNDDLHKLLGILGAKTLINYLKPLVGANKKITLGVTSGRGVGYTIGALADLHKKDDTLLEDFDDIRLQSLCGLGLIGPWGTMSSYGQGSSTNATLAVLDADTNVKLLQGLFQTNDIKENVKLCNLGVSNNTGANQIDCYESLDVILAGIGCLNTRHNFLWSADKASAVHYSAINKPLQKSEKISGKYPELFTAVADIGHTFFITCNEKDITSTAGAKENPGYSEELIKAVSVLEQSVKDINNKVLRVAEARLHEARTIMVAGGHQKREVLRAFASGGCKGPPIEPQRTWLVTDNRTAKYILGE